MDTREQFVRASLEGDAASATELFNTMMMNKVATSIDATRQEVAATLFNGVTDAASSTAES